MAWRFFERLEGRLDGLERKYARREVTAARKLLFWSLLEFFRTLWRQLSGAKAWLCRRRGDPLAMAISLEGGIGDILMYSLFVRELSRHVGTEHVIDLYSESKEVLDFVFRDFSFVRRRVGCRGDRQQTPPIVPTAYDLCWTLDRCALITYCQEARVRRKSPWLGHFVRRNELFKKENSKFFKKAPRYHGLSNQWSILTGKTRLQQPDPDQLLGIDGSSRTFLHLEAQGLDILSSRQLQKVPYITLQRGTDYRDKLSESTRLWPLRHYEQFVKRFHEAYPGIKIVQFGHAQSMCKPIPGVDLNLIGKTSLAEVVVLLKHALFHLDGDAGPVHMKRFLNGRSIVLFGTTSAEIVGYPENINLTGDGCRSWCEWVSDDWHKKCLRGFEEAPCMASISPERVLAAADRLLRERRDYACVLEKKGIRKEEIVAHILSRRHGPKAKIVDVFNRRGLALARELKRYFDDVTVFDLNFRFDSFAKAEAEGLRLEYGCLYNLALPDDACDVVLWQNGDPAVTQLRYVLKELFRILKPEGSLLISGVDFDDEDLRAFGIEAEEGAFSPGTITAFTKRVR